MMVAAPITVNHAIMGRLRVHVVDTVDGQGRYIVTDSMCCALPTHLGSWCENARQAGLVASREKEISNHLGGSFRLPDAEQSAEIGLRLRNAKPRRTTERRLCGL